VTISASSHPVKPASIHDGLPHFFDTKRRPHDRRRNDGGQTCRRNVENLLPHAQYQALDVSSCDWDGVYFRDDSLESKLPRGREAVRVECTEHGSVGIRNTMFAVDKDVHTA